MEVLPVTSGKTLASLSTRHQGPRHSVGTGRVHLDPPRSEKQRNIRCFSIGSRSWKTRRWRGCCWSTVLQPEQTTSRESLSQELQKIFAEPMTSGYGGVSVPSCRTSRIDGSSHHASGTGWIGAALSQKGKQTGLLGKLG